jgi:broad specificity phosphatase PhoE
MNMTSVPTSEKLFPDGETVDHIFERVNSYIRDVNEQFKTKTIITFTHGEAVISAIHFFRDFDYCTRREYFYPHIDGSVSQRMRIHYYDNDTGKELDLHRPHVDNYRFNID